MINRKHFLDLIKSNIDKYGYHVTIVNKSNLPRYAYTIGLEKLLGFELVFAGGIYYMKDELYIIFDSIIKKIATQEKSKNFKITIARLGRFSISKVDESWSKLMMLGFFDYYTLNKVKAYQIKPDSKHFTLDTPDMSIAWSPISETVWQWLNKEWCYSVPENSTVVTNLKALKGNAITEVMRWGNDEWEMFSGEGPNVQKENIRVVPLGLILGLDESLKIVVNLKVGKGVWRDNREGIWNAWG